MDGLDFSQGSNTSQQSQATKGTNKLFLRAVTVWINKPHVVNRRLCGSTILQVYRCQTKVEAEEVFQECRQAAGKKVEETTETEELFKDLFDEQEPYTILVRELIPKSEFFPRLYEAIFYDKEKAAVTFIPLSQTTEENGHAITPTKELSYCIKFQKIEADVPAWAQINEIVLAWTCDQTDTETPRRQVTSQWLSSVLLGKLVSWSQVDDISVSATSLQLVPVDRYKDTYVRLKNTYGRDLVKNWTERTDPEKFVYEDVAIATYLLLIWEDDRRKKGLTKKQSFVDLGCGNGLLVYILTKEGHKGLGIDLRKRKIWDTFGPDIDLKEDIVKPSSDNLFPEYDWLIGNHSDELTPWIPVIAARSSYDCSFFVLPCCQHDFVGKFGDCKKGQSRYGTYIGYVKEIVEHCGFQSEVDTLRIPSTKRICLIGRARSYKPEMEERADARRQAFIDKRTIYNACLSTKKLTVDPYGEKTMEVQSSSPPAELKHGQSSSQSEDVRGASQIENEFEVVVKRLHPAENAENQQGTSVGSDRVSTGEEPVLSKRIRLDGDTNSAEARTNTYSGTTKGSEAIFTDADSGVAKLLKSKHGSTAKGKVSTPRPTEKLSSAKNSQMPPATNARKWVAGFQPRVEQGVRNCQAVSGDTKIKIVTAVFQLVMEAKGGHEVKLSDGGVWRKGGSASLSEVAGLFDQLTLKELKSECGGLQTLLRNHSHVFQVSGGRVMLRDFSQADPWKGCNPQKRQGTKGRAAGYDRQDRDVRKTTLCWFHEHHPDGCPRPSQACTFAHGEGELRAKPDWR